MAFVNKKWRRDIGDNAVNAAARIGGAGLAAYAINKMLTIEGTTPQSNMQKTLAIMGAPGVAVIGLLGDLFVENPIVRAFCQGLYTYAAPRTIANMNDDLAEAFGWTKAPDFESNTGTSGIGNPVIMNGVGNPPIMNGVGSARAISTQTTPYVVIPKKAVQNAATTQVEEKASEEASVKGLAEAMLINN